MSGIMRGLRAQPYAAHVSGSLGSKPREGSSPMVNGAIHVVFHKSVFFHDVMALQNSNAINGNSVMRLNTLGSAILLCNFSSDQWKTSGYRLGA
jgi:hypothetical protein